jgi:hypothetical protein
MKMIKTSDAVGMALCHDVTRIIVGKEKGRLFKKGHIITEEDIPVLLDIGKNHVYVYDLGDGYVHENDAAARMAEAMCKDDIELSEVSEGKISFRAEYDGIFKVNKQAILKLNSQDDICVAVITPDKIVRRGALLGGCRVIPLAVKQEQIELFENTAAEYKDIIKVLPFQPFKIGIVTTGEEIRSGRIQDGFGSVLRNKAEETGSQIIGQVFPGDNAQRIKEAILDFFEQGANMVEVTGGMSVDPDDVTPSAIRACGGEIVTYGAPVLPGAMFMLSYLDGKPILGLPSCVMYAGRTIYDLIVPRIIAGEKIEKEDIVSLAIGGQCCGCEVCHYPDCGFI